MKRTSLVNLQRMAKKASGVPLSVGTSAIDAEATTTTAIHLPKKTLALLRRVAVERANQHGGRPSVSRVLAELVEHKRTELEAELV
jgi:hypothetical protein